MDFRPLFVTGMFRSGTTLLARMLNAHPDIALASDPFLPFLKHLRDEVAREAIGERAPVPQGPLADYFADTPGLTLFRAVQQASLDRPLSAAEWSRLLPIVRAYAEPFSQHLAVRFHELRGATFRELYLNMLQLTRAVYGEGTARYAGHKEVWADEFTPALHRAFPQLKSIHVVRDPRAVCASKNVAADKYPWLFLIRQWRKLASLAWIAADDSPYRPNALLIRYEDLVHDPAATAERICAFLGVESAAAMIDPNHLRDGDNTSWRRNSSYGDLTQERSISSKGAERWKRVLSDAEVELIEQLTFPLMSLFGYEPVTRPSTRLNNAMILSAPQVAADELTEWIRPHVRVDAVSTAAQMVEEASRLRLLEADADYEDELIDKFFLSRAVYDQCRKCVPERSLVPA